MKILREKNASTHESVKITKRPKLPPKLHVKWTKRTKRSNPTKHLNHVPSKKRASDLNAQNR